ncbi:MAG: C25 family cysteine peptidase, partial [Salinivirgaceae bacterium]|nr:C25 family cysteine peptidase [Salinivirgaceae bacterium]
MRKLLTIIVSFMILGTTWATAQSKLIFTDSDNQLKINEVTKNGFEFDLSIGKAFVKDADSKEGNYFILQTQGFTKSTQIGNPDLPSKGKLIEVPFEAAVKIEILSSETQVVNLGEKGLEGKILPCQPSLAKCGDNENLPFEFNAEVYNSDSFYGDELVSYEESGVMRGTRMGRIEMNPFRYNPITNELMVYTDMKVKVTFENANFAKTEEMKNIYGNSLFNNLLTKTMNYEEEGRPLNENQPVKLLIIADRMFEESLAPFVEWKTISGIETTVRYTDESEIGSSTTSIKSYLQDLYDAATTEDPAPSFVLLVGDVDQIPTFDGTSGSHVSDLYYFTYDGASDLIPDINYGRFSAQTTEQLDIMVEKTLLYEKYEMADPSYLSDVVLIAGVDGSYATVYGNGAINYINDVYMANDEGLNVHMYNYPESGSSAAAIIQNVSDGVAWGNYTAHCSSAGWGDPSFTNSDVPGLQNDEKYGLLIGNCCLSNKFDDNSCFGETLLRAEGKGAIGYIGGSNSTYWDEDYYWATGYGDAVQYPSYEDFGNGAYDLYYHQNIDEQPYEIWAPTQSQVNLAGQLAVEESNSTRKTYYWEIYHLMGDPTLMPWIGVPDAMSPDYLSSIVLGMSQVEVTNLPGYARVALSNDGELLATAIANASGSATLEFESFTAPTTAQVVVTAQFKQPYIGELEVIPSDEPFVVYDSHAINDGAEGNGMLDYGESVMLDISASNVGAVGTDNVELTLSSTDEYVTITEATASLGEALAETTYSVEDAFAFEVSENVPDQHTIAFTLTANDGVNDAWETGFSITANAPIIELGSIVLNDADGNDNGNLDPGEIATFTIQVANIGHAASMDVTTTLTAVSDNITVVNEIVTVSEIDGQLVTEFVHTITVSAIANIGDIAELNLEIVSGETTITQSIEEAIGLVFEDFESSDFTSHDWVNDEAYPWVITESAYEGAFAAKSGTQDHDQTSELSITMDITNEGELSFMYKASSESGYDYLRFYIDGAQQEEWSGAGDWEQATYTVAEGEHTFKWAYSKDGSVSSNDDCG